MSNSFENKEILEISRWAMDNRLTMNNFYFARGIGVDEDTQEALRNPDDTYLFVFRQDEIQKIWIVILIFIRQMHMLWGQRLR